MVNSGKIFIAGHKGMVGSAILRKLSEQGYDNFVLRSSKELDLRDQSAVNKFFEEEKPDYIFLSAAKVGGILANNKYKAEFLYDNLMIESNVIHAAWKNNAEKLLFLASSCIYPKMSPQPIKEDYLLSGPLESTNEPYAIAKIAGIKLCETYRYQYGCNFVTAMPTNLYGPNDNYHPQNAHVIPALISKFYKAKIDKVSEVTLWGTGLPRREFLHVDDLAEGCVLLMNQYNSPKMINIGSGKDITIKELALLIKKIMGYSGAIQFDPSKPDGTPRKLLDISRITALSWAPKIGLEDGLTNTIALEEYL